MKAAIRVVVIGLIFAAFYSWAMDRISFRSFLDGCRAAGALSWQCNAWAKERK